MSFSNDLKIDITEQQFKSSCCRRAFLQGVLASRATVDTDGRVTVSVENNQYADYLKRLIFENYSKEAEVYVPKSGGRCRYVSFASPSAVKYMSDFMEGGYYYTEKCAYCQSAFLRGVFFASGRVTDPAKQYLLQFSTGSSTERFIVLFEELGVAPRASKSERGSFIYFRKSSYIEDFFALAGMNSATFTLINAKIQGEIRNNANRVANCETNNIGKAVSASMNQTMLISELIEKGLISQLPEELEKTARLRMEHSDLSLSQLAAIITPHITKPGLSHRLRKITELGEALLENSKKK